jgi:hypothetical protein
MDSSERYRVEDVHKGEVDSDRLLDCHHELLPHEGSSRSYVCHVVGLSPAGYIYLGLCTTLGYE